MSFFHTLNAHCLHSYDAVFSASPEEILRSFKRFDSRVVFSAEDFCWPDTSLAVSFSLIYMYFSRDLNVCTCR